MDHPSTCNPCVKHYLSQRYREQVRALWARPAHFSMNAQLDQAESLASARRALHPALRMRLAPLQRPRGFALVGHDSARASRAA